jgi:uncharacterized damage-inducible protein DinB
MNTAAPTAPGLIDALVAQLNVSRSAIRRNLDGVSHEESTKPHDCGGNSTNWVVGHIVAARNSLLKNLGGKTIMPDASAAVYRRGSDGAARDGMQLEDLISTLDESQPLLIESLRQVPEQQLIAKSTFSSPAGPEATLGEAISAMVFHEAYHVGQLGILRRLLGKKGAI